MISYILTLSELAALSLYKSNENALRALILGVPQSMFYITYKHKTPVYI